MNVFPREFQNQCSLHRQRADNPIYKRHIAQPILCFKNEKPETWQTQTTLPRANIVLEKSNQCKLCPTMWWYIVGGDNNPISPEISRRCQRVEWEQTTKRLWRRHQIGNWTLGCFKCSARSNESRLIKYGGEGVSSDLYIRYTSDAWYIVGKDVLILTLTLDLPCFSVHWIHCSTLTSQDARCWNAGMIALANKIWLLWVCK